MAKKNCWEFKKCGRECGGANEKELGVCPVAVEERLDTLNHGKNAGRACWAVSGSMCFGSVQGTFAKKINSCLHCDFFKLVKQEEGSNLVSTKDILQKIRSKEE